MSWIGSRRFGIVEQRDGEHVETEFYCVAVPLWPQRSLYVTATTDGPIAVELRLHRRSVALGFLRFYGWMGALILGTPALVDPTRWGRLLAIAAGLALLAGVAQFVLGRLNGSERERRALISRVVGAGIPPELLTAPDAAELRVRLEQRWQRANRGTWEQAIIGGRADELLVAIAEFHQRGDLIERARASLAPN